MSRRLIRDILYMKGFVFSRMVLYLITGFICVVVVSKRNEKEEWRRRKGLREY